MTPVGEQLFAHHALLLAIPAFIPVAVVVGVVLYIARQDRLDETREKPAADSTPEENP